MPIHQKHPLIDRLNTILGVLNYPLASHADPRYLEARRAEIPDYEPNPYDRLDAAQVSVQEPEGDKYTLFSGGPTYDEQLYAWFGARSKNDLGILELIVTRFEGPPHQGLHHNLIRAVVTLVETEDALDNDEFNEHGWRKEVLRVELPFNLPYPGYDDIYSQIAAFLAAFRSDPYFPASSNEA